MRVVLIALIVGLGIIGIRCYGIRASRLVTGFAGAVAKVMPGVVGLEEAEIAVDRVVGGHDFVGTASRGMRALAEATSPFAAGWKREGTTS